jgi:hypothetical protein
LRRLFSIERLASAMALSTVASSASSSTSILLFRLALAARLAERTRGGALISVAASPVPFGWLVAAGTLRGLPTSWLVAAGSDDGAGEESASDFESSGGPSGGGGKGSLLAGGPPETCGYV